VLSGFVMALLKECEFDLIRWSISMALLNECRFDLITTYLRRFFGDGDAVGLGEAVACSGCSVS
jgi:hypothetical protein